MIEIETAKKCSSPEREVRFVYKTEEPLKHMMVYHDIQVTCVSEGDGVSGLVCNGGGNCTLCTGIAYIGLDFDIESRRIGGISGFLGKLKNCEVKSMEKPHKFQDVMLYVNSNENFLQGIGYSFAMPKHLYYDGKNKILQFGQCDGEKSYLRFLKNAYAQLDAEGHMKGFLITDI